MPQKLTMKPLFFVRRLVVKERMKKARHEVYRFGKGV